RPRPCRLDRLTAAGALVSHGPRARGARSPSRASARVLRGRHAAEVEAGVRAAVRELERLGAVVEPVSLPHTEYAIATYYLIATAEASSNLARYDGIRYGLRAPADSLGAMYEASRAAGFGTEVKRRIMLGTYALSAGYYDAYYLKAQQVRTVIRVA